MDQLALHEYEEHLQLEICVRALKILIQIPETCEATVAALVVASSQVKIEQLAK